jgi:FSR family fosmidomycin resistance protein-like MFS transporter
LRRLISLALIFFLVEFFDELHYGIQSAALPSIRTDLALTYAQVGLLLGLPKIINTLVEPLIMLLGDSSLRKRLVVGGGLVIVLALLLMAGASSFPAVLFAFIISFPASGAFVTLSQATLMDLNPGREPHSMARWTVYGSLGNLIGPALLAAAFAIGLGWRLPYLGLALLALGLALILWRKPFPSRHETGGDHAPSLREVPAWMWANLIQALRVGTLLRWVALLELSDLLLDVFTSYTALYFADVVGLNAAQTGLVLTLLMLTSLGSDLLLIPLLERVPGRRVVRTSAALSIPIFIAFLLAPWVWAKVILMVGVRLSTIGWYQVMQGEAYASVPGRSGAVMAVNSLAGLLGGAIVWFVGVAANQAGLATAMWLLLAGPLALVIFVPKPQA